MFAQYFGQFLLNRGIVTTAELDRAMSVQKQTRVKLGVLAINRGYMNAEQVTRVHDAQTRVDKRFGELSVELELMDEVQVAELLSVQQSAHLGLGQALIDQGTLSYETFAEALDEYKRDYSLSDEQFESIAGGSIDTLIEAVLMKGGARREADYVSLFAKNLIRFVDEDIRMEVGYTEQIGAYDWVAGQQLLSGDRLSSAFTGIAGSTDSLLRLASLYAQEEVEEPGEMMEAAAGEFLNLHNGIYLVNLSNQGVELEMAPQEVSAGSDSVPHTSIRTVIHVIGSQFRLELLLSDLTELA